MRVRVRVRIRIRVRVRVRVRFGILAKGPVEENHKLQPIKLNPTLIACLGLNHAPADPEPNPNPTPNPSSKPWPDPYSWTIDR